MLPWEVSSYKPLNFIDYKSFTFSINIDLIRWDIDFFAHCHVINEKTITIPLVNKKPEYIWPKRLPKYNANVIIKNKKARPTNAEISKI